MKFKLKFESLSGDTFIIEVTGTDRIDKIKRNLSKVNKIRYENLGFLFKSQFLFSDKFVSDYQMGNEEIVVYFEYENCERYSISNSVDERLKEFNINIIDQKNTENINVFVKNMMGGEVYQFNLPRRSKVEHLKLMLADRINVNEIASIGFGFNGEPLSNERTLESYNIGDHDNIIAIGRLLAGPVCHLDLSILPLTEGYDKLHLENVSNIDQIIDEIHNRYNIDKTNIRLYANADKTKSVIDINNLSNSFRDAPIVYYFIEHEINNYEIFTKLGFGSFGTTFQCKEKTSNRIYALKQFKISTKDKSKTNFEKQLACFLSIEKHPRIIELIKQINDIDSSYLLMEYIDHGSIGSIIRKNGALSETDAAKYAQQILEGLEYLHIHRIIHGNIKGDNILIDGNGNVKLSDFGLRTIFRNMTNRNSPKEVLKSEIGAINWLSPEVIRSGRLVPASDIWSFGAVMVEMITGHIPHFGLSVGQIVFAIMKRQIKFTYPVVYKNHAKSFISICLKAQPRERANFDDLFKHSFLK